LVGHQTQPWKGEFSEEEIEVVAGAGIEPATQGFSVLCSTN
jgi:hypothetical protein